MCEKVEIYNGKRKPFAKHWQTRTMHANNEWCEIILNRALEESQNDAKGFPIYFKRCQHAINKWSTITSTLPNKSMCEKLKKWRLEFLWAYRFSPQIKNTNWNTIKQWVPQQHGIWCQLGAKMKPTWMPQLIKHQW